MAGPLAQTRPAFAGLRFLSLLAALAPAPAFAGAWIAPEGGQEIWTNVTGKRGGLSFYETSTYWEAPLSERTSVVIAPWVEQNYDTLDGWRGEATLGVKRAIYRDDENVMALQGGALWVSHPPEGCSEGGAELRWLGGRALNQRAFVNVEAAGRLLDGGCESQHYDVTLGYRPADNWLAMAQVFTDTGIGGDEALHAQLTIVRFQKSGRAVQIGLRGRLDGDDSEPALVIGFWGRPGDDD